MNTISESELADFVKNRAVKKMNIIQNAEGNYGVVINLTWKEGDWNVVTTRGNVREWASLDRLSRHLKEYDGTLPPITLTFIK